MADDLLALADIIGDGLDLADYEVSDVLSATPLLEAMTLEPSSNGVTHSYNVYDTAPVVGFRAPNAGRAHDKSVESQTDVTLKYLDFSWHVDVASATGTARSIDWLLAREGMRHVKAALTIYERQLINGTIGASDSAEASGDSGGFSGFRDAGTVNALADTMVVTGGSSTADVNSSVFAININRTGIQGIYNGATSTIELGTPYQWAATDGTDTFDTWRQQGGMWLGVQVGSSYDIGRIANLDATSNTLTDDMISDLLSKFPVGYGPSHLLMSRRSLKQLQQSRTATSPSGAPAPYPMESFGVPIIVSDNVMDTEELIA